MRRAPGMNRSSSTLPPLGRYSRPITPQRRPSQFASRSPSGSRLGSRMGYRPVSPSTETLSSNYTRPPMYPQPLKSRAMASVRDVRPILGRESISQAFPNAPKQRSQYPGVPLTRSRKAMRLVSPSGRQFLQSGRRLSQSGGRFSSPGSKFMSSGRRFSSGGGIYSQSQLPGTSYASRGSLSRPGSRGSSLSRTRSRGSSLSRTRSRGSSLSRTRSRGSSLSRPGSRGSSLSRPGSSSSFRGSNSGSARSVGSQGMFQRPVSNVGSQGMLNRPLSRSKMSPRGYTMFPQRRMASNPMYRKSMPRRMPPSKRF